MAEVEVLEFLIESDLEQAVFVYLFQLQESGVTNMFGSAAYIIRQPQFSSIDLVKAEQLVTKWMNNYDKLKITLPSTT